MHAASPDPLVTVVVPVLDGERHLRESLDSILAQTYPRLEVIVMDDGSTDGTPEIVASYGDRVELVRQPERRGIYGNANDGIARARGELIGVFHADDVYLPELVEREVAWLRAHPDAGAVFCCDVFVDGDGRELGRVSIPADVRGGRPLPYATVVNALLTHRNTFLRCPTALVRASLYRELGGYRDAEFKNTSDLEMWLRIARSRPLGVLEDHLLLYRRGHGSSSERYHGARTDPDRFFEIMDLERAGPAAGGATPAARRAYEAHRAQDTVWLAGSHYILGDREAARRTLRELRLRRLLASRSVERGRLAVLAVALRVLSRLPRLSAAARLLSRRRLVRAGTPNLAGQR